MKIALFSDIHGNLPAVEVCLSSIDEQKPDAVYCLGDLVATMYGQMRSLMR